MLTTDHRKRIDIMHVTLNAQRNVDRYIIVEIYHFPINNNLLILKENIKYRVTRSFITYQLIR